MIIEIGIQIWAEGMLEELEKYLQEKNIPYYMEPARPWSSLAELEIHCEGK